MTALKTSQCMNPNCLYHNPYNSTNCQRCGLNLLLASRYRAVRQIGSGGFARTFAAVDEHLLDNPCVIKQFYPLPQSSKAYQKSLTLFRQEAEILKKLGQHAQIPELLAFTEQEGRLYIVQEFIEGLDLYREAKESGAFSEQKVRQVLVELLPVLQFIHERKVIHRDLKPSNIIRRSQRSLVLIDFGGSQQLSADFPLVEKSPITGTPGYAAPEQMQGSVSPASDLYSLAMTCIRLLTGCFPTDEEGDPLFDAERKQFNWREQDIAVSAHLEAILDKMLQWKASDRFQSAAEVLQALTLTPTITLTDKKSLTPTVSVLPDAARFQEEQPHASDDRSENPRQQFSQPRESRRTAPMTVDYSQLRALLATGNYGEADRETWNLMLRVALREQEGCLNLNAIEQFPCTDLYTIDRIWQEYSNGRFGLSQQKQIYQQLGGTSGFDYEIWRAFGDRVGWYAKGKWLNYHELTFDRSAVPGHLPACFVDVFNRAGVARGVCGWWRLGFVSLVGRMDECNCQSEPSSDRQKEIDGNLHRLADRILS
ncbi:MAG: GUN4 domain-containing protein [Hydrococcus sp. C42_A2020_068]|nr:GUN4 domain-containing protein [Hydrococcus sp. C42_A2020_068]